MRQKIYVCDGHGVADNAQTSHVCHQVYVYILERVYAIIMHIQLIMLIDSLGFATLAIEFQSTLQPQRN
jgi:hypothetical protein